MPDESVQGLKSSEAEQLLKTNGLNEIPDNESSALKKFITIAFSPISFMLLAAAILSFFTGKIFDGNFILILLLLNIVITFWQENKADSAIKKLNQHLSTKVKVMRDGVWHELLSQLLVVGDVVQLTQGDVIPADGTLLELKDALINESALTGESLPQEKKTGDVVYSGAFLQSGLMTMRVTATGKNTYFGKTLFSVDKSHKKSLLEQDIIRISQRLSILSVIAIIILTTVFVIQKASIADILTIDLTLLIAGIPISLPTVMTLITELGVVELAKKHIIVRRLSALEDLSNVTLLLTDKTGTLTKNLITIQHVTSYASFHDDDTTLYAYLVEMNDDKNPINKAVINFASEKKISIEDFKVDTFNPIDLKRKISSAIISSGGKKTLISVGAPQEIIKFCSVDHVVKTKFGDDVQDLARKGYRTIAVAISPHQKEEDMQLVGLLALSDTLREDAKSTIAFMEQNGIRVAMVTGDNHSISTEIARQVGLEGEVITREQLKAMDASSFNKTLFQKVSAFAEILPDDKYNLVHHAKNFYVVASNGDGINDLPAVKEANVGFAVKNAVDALRSTADIVLLSSGIAVIKDAIIEARKIFTRIYTYSLYRISESERLIISIVIIGIIYRVYPLTPLQLILLALLNDIPIISLAFDRVKHTDRPAKVNTRRRLVLSSLYGLTGICESLLLFFLAMSVWHLPWPVVQTIFFLKLTVSGHMLIYVAHTSQRWFKFLPSKEVILATSITQIIASLLAFSGLFMSSGISLYWIIFVWIWAFAWTQIAEIMKMIFQHVSPEATK